MALTQLRRRFSREHDAQRRALRVYFVSLQRPLRQAINARQEWLGELSQLVELTNGGKPAPVISRAGALGRTYGPRFRTCLDVAETLPPPTPAIHCHRVMLDWLKHLVDAADALVEIGQTGSITHMHVVQDHLVNARRSARDFNKAERTLLNTYDLLKDSARPHQTTA